MAAQQQDGADFGKPPWSAGIDEICGHFGVEVKEGLSDADVKRLRKQYGSNALREVKQQSAVEILVNQLKSLIVLLLCGAAILSLALHEWADGIAIAIVIVVNTAMGFYMELKAVRSMESLRKMDKATARVRRNGRLSEMPADSLVPGDILVIEGGDIVSADVRLITASKMQADESMLTGESLPVAKNCDVIVEQAILAERSNMLFKGTAVTRGSGEGIVVATGMNTELGQISSLVAEAEAASTPLEERLDKLGRKLLWVTLVIIFIVAGAGIARGKDTVLMIETAIALAVAAIPEGLPIVATMALARGMMRMARRNALVNRLAAVETLGGTSIICTDKTGTLTENRMTVTHVMLADGEVRIDASNKLGGDHFTRDGSPVESAPQSVLYEILEVSALCNNASLSQSDDGQLSGVGDPVETALLVASAKAGVWRDDLNERLPETREEAFDSDIKMMATFHSSDQRFRVAVKGAPESVLAACTHVKGTEGDSPIDDEKLEFWKARNAEMAEQGLRILAVAGKTVDSDEVAPYENLTLLGLLAMADPPRSDVKGAIESCRQAGIRVVMVTGDQARTAASIAAAVGLTGEQNPQVISCQEVMPADQMTEEDRQRFRDASIFARVSPRQKLDLIDIHQQAGSVVAMTGDGVNDAPALKKADIGVAMGLRGTQVAREAADMVLQDDAFGTIVAAVEQGRIIFGNIRKFVLFLLSCNVSEIMIVFLASLVQAPLPILPLQILFLNLVTDVFPALALGVGEGDPSIMARKPRDADEPMLMRRHWLAIFGYGALLTFAVLGAFAIALKAMKLSTTEAVTVSFLTLAFSQLWHIFNMRDNSAPVFSNDVTRNKFAWAALGLCTVLLVMAVYVPILAKTLKLANPGFRGWLLVLGASVVPLILGQIAKIAVRNRK